MPLQFTSYDKKWNLTLCRPHSWRKPRVGHTIGGNLRVRRFTGWNLQVLTKCMNLEECLRMRPEGFLQWCNPKNTSMVRVNPGVVNMKVWTRMFYLYFRISQPLVETQRSWSWINRQKLLLHLVLHSSRLFKIEGTTIEIQARWWYNFAFKIWTCKLTPNLHP